jgi:hypothetical protein
VSWPCVFSCWAVLGAPLIAPDIVIRAPLFNIKALITYVSSQISRKLKMKRVAQKLATLK